MRHRSISFAAVLFLVFSCFGAFAQARETATWLVVLRDASKAPDLSALGAELVASSMNRRVVLLPEDRIEELRNDPAVAYVQRIWSGEPLSDSPRPAPRSASSVVSNATLYEDWASGEYRYDGSGNIRKIGNDAYGYDRVSRITGASIPSRNVSETYAYDPFGNLERLGAKTFALQHSTNRLEPPLMTYDGGGFVTGDTTAPNRPRTYHYDALGMMTAIDDVSEDRRMIYTADDERIVLSVGENTSYRIRDFGGKVLREWKSAAGVLAWDRDWIYGDGQLLAGAVQVDTRLDPARHYHADHLGSIRMVTDGAGTTITRNDFAPFGRELTETSQEYDNTAHVRDPLKFTAHERDYFSPANVNDDDYVDDMHARYYGAGVGRFLEIDPVMNAGTLMRPQMWNRYSYVMNSPLNFTDPTGRYPCKIKLKGTDAKTAGVPSGTKVDGECVERKAPPRSLFSFNFPHLSFALERRAQKAREEQPNRSTFTPSQCQSLFKVVQREAREGTQRAAARSSNTWGDRTIGQFNVDFNTRGNPTLSNGSMIDVDWLTDVNSYTGNMPAAAPVAYVFGKSYWHAVGGTQGWPFQDPGEVTALSYASRGASYNELYNQACP